MTSRQGLFGVLAVLLVVGLFWYASFLGHADAPLTKPRPGTDAVIARHVQVADAEAQPPGNPFESLRAPTGPASMAWIMARHTTLAAVMQEAIAIRGASDPDVVSAVLDAVGICQELPEESALSDPNSGLMAGHEDSSKIAAIGRLETWCEGFDSAAMMKLIGTSHAELLAAAQSGTAEQQLDHAREHLRGGSAFERQVAGRRMIDAGLLSVAGPDRRPHLSKHQMALAWWMASELAGCQRGLGCGPNSPTTLYFCARAGCAPGLPLDQAIRRSVPPEMYAGVAFFPGGAVPRSEQRAVGTLARAPEPGGQLEKARSTSRAIISHSTALDST